MHGCRFDNRAIEHAARSHCHIDLPSAAALELSATADAGSASNDSATANWCNEQSRALQTSETSQNGYSDEAPMK